MEKKEIIKQRKFIGRNIRKGRISQKLSYYRVAKDSGISISIIQSIEAGDAAYTIDSLLAVYAVVFHKKILPF